MVEGRMPAVFSHGCLILSDTKTRQATFANDPRGHAALLAWADRHAGGAPLHFCMEATGPYSEAPAAHLADARLIAEYAQRERPPAWPPPSPEVRELQGLVRRIDELTEAAAREKGRLASPALTAEVRKSVTRTVRLLEKEVARLRADADALVATAPTLRADRDLLESIPGVGRRTATTVLAELPAADRLPSAQVECTRWPLSPASGNES